MNLTWNNTAIIHLTPDEEPSASHQGFGLHYCNIIIECPGTHCISMHKTDNCRWRYQKHKIMVSTLGISSLIDVIHISCIQSSSIISCTYCKSAVVPYMIFSVHVNFLCVHTVDCIHGYRVSMHSAVWITSV